MDILTTLNEYKSKIESLAGKAAQFEDLNTQFAALASEKETLANTLTEKEGVILSLGEKVTALESEVVSLKADIDNREASKKASDERAMEIVASLGLKEIPILTITETDKPSADAIRQKYMAISDPVEKGKYFNENRNAILNGVLD